jgi:hypothetical protein
VLLAVGCALAAMVLFGIWVDRERGSAPVATPPQPTTVASTADGPIVYSGTGSQSTAPFYLAGGAYHSRWSAWGESAVFPPCTHSVSLLAVDPAIGDVLDLATLVQVPSTGATQESDVRDLKPGTYFFDVTSECAWQIAITPS